MGVRHVVDADQLKTVEPRDILSNGSRDCAFPLTFILPIGSVPESEYITALLKAV